MAIRFLSNQTIDSTLDLTGRVKVSGNNTDQYFYEGARTGVGVTFSLYDNANNVYFNGYSGIVLRANQIGGSGGSIILSGGNVGIGLVPAGSVALDVKEPDASNDLILGLTAGTGSRAQIRSVVQTSTESALSFHTTLSSSTQERFRILNTGAFSLGNSGTNYGTSGQVLTSNGNAAPYWSTPTTGTITGSGTANYVTKFTGTTAIGNSSIVDNGNVGIGGSPSTFSNYTNVSIKGGSSGGNLDFHNSSGTRVAAIVSTSGSSLTIETNENTPLIFQSNQTETMRITGSKFIGVFGNSNPTAPIDFGTTTPNRNRMIGTYVTGNLFTGVGMSATTAGIRLAGDGGADNLLDVGYYSTDGNYTWTTSAFFENGRMTLKSSTQDPYLFIDGSDANRDSGIIINAGGGNKTMVRLDVGGTMFFYDNAFRIASNGDVGIGVTPSVNLDINKSGARLRLTDGTNQINMGLWDGSNYRFEGDANRPIYMTSYQGNINFGISGGLQMTVDAAGVNSQGDVRVSGGVTRLISNQIQAGYNQNVDNTDIWINYLGYLGNAAYFRDFRIGNGKTGQIAVFDGSTSRVGIGHNAPQSRLSIVGPGADNAYSGVIGIENSSSAKWGYITFTDDIDTISSSSNYYLIGRGQSYTDRHFSFHVPRASDYGSGSEPKFIFASTGADQLFTIEAGTGNAYHKGSVGIGTTTPESGAKLDVRAGSGGKIVFGSYDANYKVVVEGGDQLNFFNGASGTTAYVNYAGPADVLLSRNFYVESNSSGGVSGTVRVKSDGRVGVGTTAPSARLQVNYDGNNGGGGAYTGYGILHQSSASGQATIGAHNTGDGYANLNLSSTVGGAQKLWHISKRPNSNSNRLEYFFFDTTFYSRFIFTYLGDFHADGDIVAYSTTASDEKLKDNIEPIHNALDKVSKLNGVSFTWNCGSRKDEKDLGVIAQNVEKVLPELVREKESPYHDDQTIKTVDYEKLTAVLIEAVKELQQKVEKLENKNCACKG